MSEAFDLGRLDGALPPDAQVDAKYAELAHELHDVVGSACAVINLQAAAAARLLRERPEQALEALAEIRRASGEVVEELRAIVPGIRNAGPGRSNRVGLGGIGRLAESATKAGIHTRVTVSGRWRPLPADVDLAAYRIVQESLTNVLRHSNADSASVLVAYEHDVLRIAVEDDGRGGSLGHGFGIIGRRERAAALGGELEAGPIPGAGFRVEATLPLLGPG